MTRIFARMLILSVLALALTGCLRSLDTSSYQPTPAGGGNAQGTPVAPIITTLPPTIIASPADETLTPGAPPTTEVVVVSTPTLADTPIPSLTASPSVTPLPVIASPTPQEAPQVVTVVVTSPPVVVTQIITTTPLPTIEVLAGTPQPLIVTSPPIVITQIITTTPEPTQLPIIITTTPEPTQPPIVITTTPEPTQPPIVITTVVTAEPGTDNTNAQPTSAEPTEITQVPLPTMPGGPTPTPTLDTTVPAASLFPAKIEGARGDIINNQCDYKAVKDDRLIRIAQRFSLTVQQILDANKSITNPNIIYPDQIIKIPGCLGPGQ